MIIGLGNDIIDIIVRQPACARFVAMRLHNYFVSDEPDEAAISELAEAFVEGDRLVVVQETGDLLHIPQADHERVQSAVGAALGAFHALADATDDQLTQFFAGFADRLADDAVFAPIAAANAGGSSAASAAAMAEVTASTSSGASKSLVRKRSAPARAPQ